MSISSTALRKAGPYSGNGATTAFPFYFKVFTASDVLVVQTDLSAVETVQTLTTQYTVTLNANQDNTPGGTVTMLVAPPSGYLLTLGSQVPATQPMVLTNTGGMLPTVLNDEADRITILAQQLLEKVSRALSLPFSVSASVSSQLPLPVASNLIGWDSLGASLINYAGVASAAVSAAMAPIVSAASVAAARVGLGAAASGANTDITSLASPALGSATATTQTAGDSSTKVATTAFVAANTYSPAQSDTRYAGAMPNFTASTSSALITASLGVGKVDFRNAVLTTGTPIEYNVTTPLTLAMNSIAGSLGATTAVATSLVYAIVYGAGAPQIAVANISGGLQMDETNLITTTAIGAGSTAANVWYSTSAIATPSQYRIIGRVDATWTSGIGWASPTLVQPVGIGEAMAAMSNLGYGQTWQTVTRVSGTTYYNTTGKPIFAAISNQFSTTAGPSLVINGFAVGTVATAAANTASLKLSAIIPVGSSYSATGAWDAWAELR